MAKVEVEYNPYLLETKVLFNGKEPRINSLVEKYMKSPLSDWINYVPEVFYDEMNGYDFDIDFSGTDLDFEELEKVFIDKGISGEDVRFFHKKELESRLQKIRRITEVMDWMSIASCRKIDIEMFKNNNSDMFEQVFQFIIIGKYKEEQFDYFNLKTQIVYIEDINDLVGVDLSFIPLIICFNENNIKTINAMINTILGRSDISEKQVFFNVSREIKEDIVRRRLIDLGINKPQIIHSINDEIVKKYFEINPLSKYIYDSINILTSKSAEIESILQKDNIEFEKTNGEIVSQLHIYDEHIEMLKKAILDLSDLENVNMPSDWSQLHKGFIKEVSEWKIKKSVINDDEDAKKLSEQYEKDIVSNYDRFIEEILKKINEKKQELKNTVTNIYANALWDKKLFKMTTEDSLVIPVEYIPSIKKTLLSYRETHYEKEKQSFFDSILKNSSEDEEEVLVISYSCQAWRTYAEKVVYKITNDYMEKNINEVNRYYHSLAEECVNYLKCLLEEQTELKNNLSGKLSEDNMLLQKDNDWLIEFKDRIKEIERM